MAQGCWYDSDAAAHAVEFFERFLRHSKGRWAGKPFRLLKWQKDELIGPLFGWRRADGTRRFRIGYVEIPKKNGKALALDTQIPVPGGWITMAEVCPGDTVFDEYGKQCSVVACTETMLAHRCYRVSFSDGTSVIADAGHLWRTHTRKPEGHHDTWTTEEIADSLRLNYKTSAGYNHSIHLKRILDMPDADLPVDPYVLGVWLGDGHSRSARITIPHSDAEIVGHISECGVSVDERESSNDNSGLYLVGSRGRGSERSLSCQAMLRQMGVLRNKHIPSLYLRAGYDQRMALLQGLMDTDGYASKAGQCEFTTTCKALCDGFLDLARGLGYKPTLKTGRALLYGKDCGPKYRIQFWSFKDRPAFRLSRKAARLKSRPAKRPRSSTVHIVSVEPVDSVPVKCIQVNSSSGMFLCGDGMIPTHNSTLSSGISLYLLVADGESGAEVYCAAADRMQAGIVYKEAASMVRNSPVLAARLKVTDSQKNISHAASGSFLRVLSSEAYTSEGLNIHGLIFDELHAQRNRDLWDALRYGGAAREQPLLLSITTAGYDRHSICYEQHDYARKVLDGVIEDVAFFPFIRAAGEGDDWTKPKTWRKANPSFGVTINAEDFAQACKEAQDSPAKENAFRRYRLNQWTEQAVRWLRMEDWDACAGEIDPGALEGERCYAGLDLASTTDVAAFVLYFPDEGQVLPYFFVPAENARERERRDRVPYPLWARQGALETTEGNIIDYDVIRRRINELADLYDIQEIATDPWNATQLTTQLSGDGFEVVAFRQGFASMSAPTKELEKRVRGGRLQHGEHPVLRWMASNVAVEHDAAENLKPSKKVSTERIDGIVALIMALGRAMVEEDDDFDGDLTIV